MTQGPAVPAVAGYSPAEDQAQCPARYCPRSTPETDLQTLLENKFIIAGTVSGALLPTIEAGDKPSDASRGSALISARRPKESPNKTATSAACWVICVDSLLQGSCMIE